MNGKFLLDTNIIIALFDNDPSVINSLSQANGVFVPSIALGELYYGAHKSKHVKENINRINKFAENLSVLICDTETSRMYGMLKNDLRAKGRPIPENDIWIAAIAKKNEMTLVSRDEHFKEIDGLSIVTW